VIGFFKGSNEQHEVGLFNLNGKMG
ncbi:uncharacterized protein METZ01_LOCUS365630, partial [marine metagenome]